MNIRKVIMNECKRRGWSAYRLAKETGLVERTVQTFFQGTRDISSGRASKMLDALGIEMKIRKGGR